MKTFLLPVAAEVRQDTESEAALIQRVKQSITKNNWTIGECASMWTARWAKGRTDDDFGAAVGMTGDQVGQRRRVWDRFGKSDTYQFLSWSHYYAALNWDDADAFLQWACENQATVAEMKAWRTSQTGESDTVSVSGSSGNSGGSGDPFEEAGREGSGGEEDGQETGGTDSEEPPPPAGGRRQGRAGGEREVDPEEAFRMLKAKAIKTYEAAMRVTGDLNEVHPLPQADAMRKAVSKIILTLKGVE